MKTTFEPEKDFLKKSALPCTIGYKEIRVLLEYREALKDTLDAMHNADKRDKVFSEYQNVHQFIRKRNGILNELI